jgi:tight adherence protein B
VTQTEPQTGMLILANLLIGGATLVAVYLGWRPFVAAIFRQEDRYDLVLRRRLLWRTPVRSVTVVVFVLTGLVALLGYVVTGSVFGAIIFGLLSGLLPPMLLKWLQRRHLRALDDQLVPGIQTLASGVRAGLNLVQSMQLVARDGPKPLKNEITHLLQEYEYGVALDDAMSNAATRIGSGDYRLLFSALQTHRQRGGDLGATLDRIAESIREIQRLEKRLESLTAQGRATARWLGVMPIVVLALLFFLIDPEGVKALFLDPLGKLMLTGVLVLNLLGFLWVRKIMAVDI